MMRENESENNIYRLLRIARDLKVKDVAEKLNVSPAYICAIEAGKREPSINMLSDYAHVLGIDANTLLELRNTKKPPDKFEEFLFYILKKIIEFDNH